MTEELLREMTRRIREAGDPHQIILFGSHAREEAGPQSDLDLLVIEDVGRSRREHCTSVLLAISQLEDVADASATGSSNPAPQRGRRSASREYSTCYECYEI